MIKLFNWLNSFSVFMFQSFYYNVSFIAHLNNKLMKTENSPCQLKKSHCWSPSDEKYHYKWTLKMFMSDFFSDKTSIPSFWAQQ